MNKLKNITALVTAVNSVAAFVIYYYYAVTHGRFLEDLYFLSICINFFLVFGLLFTILGNKEVRGVMLGCSIFFLGLSTAYVIDWIGSGAPKMNHVYLCFIIGISTSLFIILYQWIKQFYTRK